MLVMGWPPGGRIRKRCSGIAVDFVDVIEHEFVDAAEVFRHLGVAVRS